MYLFSGMARFPALVSSHLPSNPSCRPHCSQRAQASVSTYHDGTTRSDKPSDSCYALHPTPLSPVELANKADIRTMLKSRSRFWAQGSCMQVGFLCRAGPLSCSLAPRITNTVGAQSHRLSAPTTLAVSAFINTVCNNLHHNRQSVLTASMVVEVAERVLPARTDSIEIFKRFVSVALARPPRSLRSGIKSQFSEQSAMCPAMICPNTGCAKAELLSSNLPPELRLLHQAEQEAYQ